MHFVTVLKMTDRFDFWRVANRNRIRKLEKAKGLVKFNRRTFPDNLRRLQRANRKKYKKMFTSQGGGVKKWIVMQCPCKELKEIIILVSYLVLL